MATVTGVTAERIAEIVAATMEPRPVVAHGAVGPDETFDVSVGNRHSATLNQNSVFTFTNPPVGTGEYGFTLYLTISPGGFTVTWPGSVIWNEGTAPEVSGECVLRFNTINGGTTWYGFLAGKDMA